MVKLKPFILLFSLLAFSPEMYSQGPPAPTPPPPGLPLPIDDYLPLLLLAGILLGFYGIKKLKKV